MNREPSHPTPADPPFWQAFAVWMRIGLLSFGGPAAQIALMHRVIVEERCWLGERQFLSALGFCMLLPGPEAMQLATYAGWRIHGVLGGLVAGLLFVLPGVLIVLGMAAIYVLFGTLPVVETLFLGIKAAVIVVVIEALMRVSKQALTGVASWGMAGLAFIAIFALDLPFPLIIGCAALAGFWLGADGQESHGKAHGVSTSTTLLTVMLWLAVWWLPLGALWLLGANGILLQIGLFFSKLAVVTFGGAYAVLAYMAQDVVGLKGWLSASEMIDGLGLAETTPGPLILVTEFVGFIAGFRDGGWTYGLHAALITLWVTFVPCFLWIFAGAPYIEWITDQPRLCGALNAITAAIVGVMLNLSIWFALHVLFETVDRVSGGPFTIWWPNVSTFQALSFVLALFAAFLLLVRHWSLPLVLALNALAAFALTSIF